MIHRVFVTGTTGFIGSHILDEVAAEGYCVRTLRRSSQPGSLPSQNGVESYHGDLLNSIQTERAVTGCQTIIHAAAKIGDWGSEAEYLRANLGMLKNILTAAARGPVIKRLILISSLGVYEPGDHNDATESEPMALNALDGYTLSKIECEKYFCDWLKSNPSVEGIILRPGFVYGPRDRTVIPQLVTSLRQKRFAYFGTGEKKLNATYVKNLTHAVMLALKKAPVVPGTPHIYNVRDGVLPSRVEFVEAFAKTVGMSCPKVHIPERLAAFLCQACEKVAKITGARRPPLLSRAKYKFLAYNLDFSIERIKAELGYQPPYNLNSAMEETAAWVLTGQGAHGASLLPRVSPHSAIGVSEPVATRSGFAT